MGDSCLTFSAFCSCGTRSSFSRLTSGFFSGARMRHVILDVCNGKREKHRFKNRIQLTHLTSTRGPLLLCINLDFITRRVGCVSGHTYKRRLVMKGGKHQIQKQQCCSLCWKLPCFLLANRPLWLVCFVFPIEVPGELDPLSFHKLCAKMHVNKTKSERNSSLEFCHMTCIRKTKHTS